MNEAEKKLLRVAELSMAFPKDLTENHLHIWEAFENGQYWEKFKKETSGNNLCENCDPQKMPLCNKCLGV